MSRKTVILILCLVLAACNMPQSQQTTDTPQTWFDMPINNSSHPLASVQVIFHASDPGGISQAELWVNGQPAGSFNSLDTKASLVTFNRNWTPPTPGKYTLRVRARNNKQIWSEFTQTTIVIQGQRTSPQVDVTLTPEITSTTTLTPIATMTPTITPTLTSTLTPTRIPTLTPTTSQSGGVSIERGSTNLIYLGRADCGPLEVTITARATAPNGIKVVVLFYRFQTGSSSSEFQSIGMNPIGGDLYERTLNPTSLFGGSVPFDEATLQYQVVIQQNNGDVSLRTPVMADIVVKACGSVTASCSSYTDERTCIANGCNWVNIPGTVPIYECRNP